MRERTSRGESEEEIFDAIEVQRRMADRYNEAAMLWPYHPQHRLVTVDASHPLEEVINETMAHVIPALCDFQRKP